MSNWLAGLVVGAGGGFLALIAPTLGWGIILVFGLLALRRAPRLSAFGGLFLGLGASWLVVLIRSHLECQAFNAVPGQACGDPDIGAWLAFGGALLVVGTVVSAITVVGARRPA